MIGARFEVRKANGDPLIFKKSRFRRIGDACDCADSVGGHVNKLDGWGCVYQSRKDQEWFAKYGEGPA